MIKHSVRVPMAQVIDARRTCKALADSITALKMQLAALDELDPIQDGIDVRNRAMEERQRINGEIEQAKAEAIDAIKGRALTYRDDVNRQTAQHGEELDDAPDYELIREGLINDPVQLKMIADRNMGNYTMLTAIDRYAVRKQWPGFTLVTNAPVVLTFGENWFRMCEYAAHEPDCLSMMQIQTPGELRRLLMEYGVLDAAQLPDDEA